MALEEQTPDGVESVYKESVAKRLSLGDSLAKLGSVGAWRREKMVVDDMLEMSVSGGPSSSRFPSVYSKR